MSRKDKTSRADQTPEELAAVEARKAEKAAKKAAEKAAERAAKMAAREAKAAAKHAAKEAARAAKAARKAEKAARKQAEAAAVKSEKAKDGKAKDKQPKDKQPKDKQPKDKQPKDATHKKGESAESAAAPRFKHVRKKKLSSGKGPTALEIGQSLVALFNAGKSDEAESTWYHRKIESIEEDGSVFEGWKGVQEKGAWWKANFTVLSMKASGPYVCSTGFTVVYSGRVRMADGTEVDAHECGVYTVEDGRIVREQFMKWNGASGA